MLITTFYTACFGAQHPHRRPTYTGLANTLVGLVSAAAPLLGVLLAQLSYPTLFAASGLAALAGLLYMLWQVKEPRSGL